MAGQTHPTWFGGAAGIAGSFSLARFGGLHSIPRCPGCNKPAFATETDDDNYHPQCRPALLTLAGGR